MIVRPGTNPVVAKAKSVPSAAAKRVEVNVEPKRVEVNVESWPAEQKPDTQQSYPLSRVAVSGGIQPAPQLPSVDHSAQESRLESLAEEQRSHARMISLLQTQVENLHKQLEEVHAKEATAASANSAHEAVRADAAALQAKHQQKQDDLIRKLEQDFAGLKETMAEQQHVNNVSQNGDSVALQQSFSEYQQKQDSLTRKLEQELESLQKHMGINARAPPEGGGASNDNLRAAFQQSLWVRQHKQEELTQRLEQDVKSLQEQLGLRISSIEQQQAKYSVPHTVTERITERIAERRYEPIPCLTHDKASQDLQAHHTNLQELVDGLLGAPRGSLSDK